MLPNNISMVCGVSFSFDNIKYQNHQQANVLERFFFLMDFLLCSEIVSFFFAISKKHNNEARVIVPVEFSKGKQR